MRVRLQRLPTGYREVEYLESTGTQYIDTGLSLPSGFRLKTKIIPNTNLTDNMDILGTNSSSSLRNFFMLSPASGPQTYQFLLGYGSGDSGYTYFGKWANNGVYEIDISNIPNNRFAYINGVQYVLTDSSNVTYDSNNLYMFAGHRSTPAVTNYFYGKIYATQIWSSAAQVRNFIPCIRTSDSKPGLYDTINDVFYVNQGTGEFIKGPYKDGYKLNLYPRLPSAYQEVEYIEFTGTQYIDTQKLATVGKTYIQEADIQFTAYPSYSGRGLNGGDKGFYWGIFNDSGSVYFVNTYTTSLSPNKAGNLNKHHFISIINSNQSSNTLIIDGTSFTSNRTSAYTSSTILLGTNSATVAGNFAKQKLYTYKIYEDSVLVRNYIPCYRKSDSTIGLFDTVNQAFYSNSGTGTFSKGNNVYDILRCRPRLNALPDAYQGVEYIESTGTQYINTGVSYDANNVYICKFLINNLQYPQSNYSGIMGQDGKIQIAYGVSGVWQTGTGTGGSVSINTVYVGRVDCTTQKLYIDDVYVASRSSQRDVTTKIGILGYDSYRSYARVYSAQIYNSNILVRNFIPCYRKSDNVIGLYDTVGKQFYTNAGTGTFTKGPNKAFII